MALKTIKQSNDDNATDIQNTSLLPKSTYREIARTLHSRIDSGAQKPVAVGDMEGKHEQLQGQQIELLKNSLEYNLIQQSPPAQLLQFGNNSLQPNVGSEISEEPTSQQPSPSTGVSETSSTGENNYLDLNSLSPSQI